jgi:hypothetical protein
MKYLALLCGLAFVVPAIGQEQTPTVAKCVFDAVVWDDSAAQNDYLNAQTAFLSNGTPNNTDVQKLGLEEVVSRATEMGACETVDLPNFARYDEIHNFYSVVISNRMTDFLKRHNLLPQFRAEDAQGLR